MASKFAKVNNTLLEQLEKSKSPEELDRTSGMDANAKNSGCLKTKLRRDTCSVCGIPESKLFLIPSDENRYV
ncbi:hypothetical protein AVEN_61403-1 [Araneus ventricosus]|uniref:Uncharacterized protein n=1 Tax=Araneus ventricosus TaxID=182803 RepID=A0A4Y2QG39_ARAVE|nr:hypothetical protein AVEN_61403-1 [Araneus ventricosus]